MESRAFKPRHEEISHAGDVRFQAERGRNFAEEEADVDA